MGIIINDLDNRINNISNSDKKAFIQRAKLSDKPDSFEKEDKSNNGKFDFSEVAKNFGKGVISPITAIIKHPVATIGMIAGTVAATSLIPVLGPALAVSFGVLGVYQIGKGSYDAVKNYKNGDYDKAEQSFDQIGQGVVGTIMSAFGIKQSAKIAKEAKLMNELKTNTLTPDQKISISNNIDKGSKFNALKEVLSLFTTKKGIKSTIAQFKPSSIKTRINEYSTLFKKMNKSVENRPRKLTPEEFKKTPEGIRRASLSDQEIQKEVQGLYDEAFDQFGVPKAQRPKLKIEKDAAKTGGSYNHISHTLKFNPESYKSGTFEMENVIAHEATHCREALLRAGLPKERAEAIVKEQLLSRIQNGECEEILVQYKMMDTEMMTPPKMSSGMKNDFAQFASDNLYTKQNQALISYYNAAKKGITPPAELAKLEQKAGPVVQELRALLAKHPEFSAQYKTSEEAMNTLLQYSVSHNVRYSTISDTRVTTLTPRTNAPGKFDRVAIQVDKLSDEEMLKAENSLINYMETREGNARISGLRSFTRTSKDYNQYQFSPEEVLAQKNGNSFLIDKLTARLNELKASGKLSPEEEQAILRVIDKAQTTIEYKTKGLEYYKKYTQMINNPEDKELAQTVKNLEQELAALKKHMTGKDYDLIQALLKDVQNANLPTTQIPISAIFQLLAKVKDCPMDKED